MRILIVDDEAAVAGLLAEAVEQQGHEVVIAHHGVEALAALGRQVPDAVFLDIRMPDMAGVEVLRRIRETHPTLPVIVITGHARDDELDEVQRLGVADVIKKPLILNHLSATLGTLNP